MIYIGDIHGKWERYLDIIARHPASIQVGDFGLGFPGERPEARARLEDGIAKGDHRFIRGNHDNPETCFSVPYHIPSGTFEDGRFFIGGAHSIDRAWRREEWDWWEAEEHGYQELMDLITEYEKLRPSIMVTHDAPDFIARQLFPFYKDPTNESRTRQALQTMYEIHKPDLWIFGHWHQSVKRNILGTEFICLNELETLEL